MLHILTFPRTFVKYIIILNTDQKCVWHCQYVSQGHEWHKIIKIYK